MERKSEYVKLQEDIRKLKIEPSLKAFDNKYPEGDYWVSFHTEEFNAVCPRTGLPDFAEIFLSYKPDKKILESKAAKLYLTAYRNVGIFHEFAINKIFSDFIEVVQPKEAIIEGHFNARGGIAIKVERHYTNPKLVGENE